MNPAAVPCPDQVTITVAADLTHRCPFVPEVDHGTATITWTTAGATVELHSLAAWLDGFRDETLSHEAITRRIQEALAALPGVTDVHVTTRWVTAQLAVEVASRVVSRERLVRAGA